MSTVEVRTAELIYGALDWAVAKVEGLFVEMTPPNYGDGSALVHLNGADDFYRPSANWHQGGPLIDKYAAQVRNYPTESGECVGSGLVAKDGMTYWMAGPTPLIALCRAIVAAHLGETVQVPEELTP